MKYNAAGVEQWSRTFRGPHGLENSAYAIAVDGAGNVVVAGSYVVTVNYTGNLNSRLNFGTFKYDPNGNVLWFANYGDTNNVADFPAAMALDAAGNVLITGFSENFEGRGGHWVTLKYGAGGELQWIQGRERAYYDPPAGVAVDAAGNAYVSGTLRDESFQPVITTIKYGPGGDEVWTAQFEEPGFFGLNYGSSVTGVHVDSNGRVLVAGAIGSYTHDVIALAYSQQPSPGAPVILSQPQDIAVPFRGMAQFSVTTSNALRFQWQFNGVDLPGANNATLVIPAADVHHDGSYAVRVENDTYCVVSETAQLTLNVPVPVITRERFDNGYFNFIVIVTPGRPYRIQASTDLLNWETVWEDWVYGRFITFYDSASPWQSRRFYRVIEGAGPD